MHSHLLITSQTVRLTDCALDIKVFYSFMQLLFHILLALEYIYKCSATCNVECHTNLFNRSLHADRMKCHGGDTRITSATCPSKCGRRFGFSWQCLNLREVWGLLKGNEAFWTKGHQDSPVGTVTRLLTWKKILVPCISVICMFHWSVISPVTFQVASAV